jgi:transketolase
MTPLHYRILEISHKHRLSHLGSNIGAVDILDEIYGKRQAGDPFILSSGHAGLALYVILEKYLGMDPEDLLVRHGIHPDKDLAHGLYCSTGSLGLGLPIAVGRALADRSRNVWCLISDGECAEGSIYEACNIIRRYKITNLKVYINWNFFGAYHETDWLGGHFLRTLLPDIEIRGCGIEYYGIPFLRG